MNEIQKYFFEKMIAELYEAQAELMKNIHSKDSHRYFNGAEKDNLPSEIFNSFKELEDFLRGSVINFQSNVTVNIGYTSLHARESGHPLFFQNKPKE